MKNISSMAALAALLLVSCGQDTDVKFAGDEGAKVTFSASINEQNSQDVSRVTGVTWDDGDEVSISCGPTQKNVFYRYNAADNSFTAINRFDEIWLLGNEEYDVTAYYPHVGEEGTVPPVQTVEITSENQDTPEERAAFDFLYASTKATKAEPNVHLNFNHAMSRVNLKFVPGTDPEGNPVTFRYRMLPGRYQAERYVRHGNGCGCGGRGCGCQRLASDAECGQRLYFHRISSSADDRS